MAKAKKLPSGNWRVLVYSHTETKNGKKIRKYKSFTAPTRREAELAAAEYANDAPSKNQNYLDYTLRDCITKYIDTHINILSPTTVHGYRKIQRNNLQDIMDMKIKNITPEIVQASINIAAQTLAPKTISNAHGLVSSVLRVYRPGLVLRTTLPKKKKQYKTLLPPATIIEIVRGTQIELPVLLAMWLSLSMSEIRGIRKDDISDGCLTLQRSVVDVGKETVEKDQMKAYERTRQHILPPYIQGLVDAVETDYLVPLSAKALYMRWTRLLQRHNLPHMAFHDLRHVNASVMLFLGIPDKYAMERGGWKTDRTMKQVYQHTYSEERKKYDEMVDNYFNDIIDGLDGDIIQSKAR